MLAIIDTISTTNHGKLQRLTFTYRLNNTLPPSLCSALLPCIYLLLFTHHTRLLTTISAFILKQSIRSYVAIILNYWTETLAYCASWLSGIYTSWKLPWACCSIRSLPILVMYVLLTMLTSRELSIKVDLFQGKNTHKRPYIDLSTWRDMSAQRFSALAFAWQTVPHLFRPRKRGAWFCYTS